MAHLVTGYAGYAHIKSEDDAAFNASFFGNGQYVMESGNQFEGSIINNNTIRILDGDGLMYGRHFRIEPNVYEDVAIETGTANKNRIDLICMTYEKNAEDGTEKAYLEVIKGTETEGTAVEPEYINGNILEGAVKNQMPLYKVTIEGVVLENIKQLFTTIPTYKTLAEKYAEQFEITIKALKDANILDSMKEIEANTKENMFAGALALKEGFNNRTYNYGAPFIFGATQESTLLDMINLMVIESTVSFWINNSDSYPKVYEEVMVGCNKYGYVDAYGIVTIEKINGSTVYVKWRSYENADKAMKISFSAINDVGWSEWEKIATGTDLENYLTKENPTGTGSFSLNRKADTTVGVNSTAIGNNATASSEASHAEGNNTTASSKYAHAEGDSTTADAMGSHVEGCGTKTSGMYAHAEGMYTTASGKGSHAEGMYTTAYGAYAHAEGNRTTALDYQHAQGHYNNTNVATKCVASGTSDGTAFVIGNGNSSSASNAMRVTGKGQIYSPNTTILSGADYAEYFEWSDGNPDKEDRVGYFVTIDEDNPEKIRIANEGDYILGIISGLPSVIGNGDEDWRKRYILDDFGRYIEETFEYEEKIVDEETGEESTVTKTGTKWKENPEYDSSKPYLPRDLRPEWSAVGMVGVLSVYDDGTCQVNGYCKCSNNGIATAVSERGIDTYRVLKRVTDNIIKVIIKP